MNKMVVWGAGDLFKRNAHLIIQNYEFVTIVDKFYGKEESDNKTSEIIMDLDLEKSLIII